MANLSTAQSVEVLFENALDTYEHQMQMLDLVDVFTPDPAAFQNSSNIIWRPVQQHAPIKEGWNLTGMFGDVIEEYYPATLQDPRNDAFQLRADESAVTAMYQCTSPNASLYYQPEADASRGQFNQLDTVKTYRIGQSAAKPLSQNDMGCAQRPPLSRCRELPKRRTG